LVAAGLHSSLANGRPQGLVMNRLALQLPEQQIEKLQPAAAPKAVSARPAPLDGIKRLPGRDGSASLPVSVVSAPSSSDEGEMRKLGRAMSADRFGDSQWPALNNLWTRESNWNPAARNSSSGACGIPQALPCSKIPDMSPEGQIKWGLTYIQRRYGTPANAWQHWLRHHWY
jgi:hypothetical protein